MNWFSKKKNKEIENWKSNFDSQVIKNDELHKQNKVFQLEFNKLMEEVIKLRTINDTYKISSKTAIEESEKIKKELDIYQEQVMKVQSENVKLTESLNKSSILIQDILESVFKKKEIVTYVTKEGNVLTVKDECFFKEINDESEIEAINGLMIKLLPYINNSKVTIIPNPDDVVESGTTIINEITILIP